MLAASSCSALADALAIATAPNTVSALGQRTQRWLRLAASCQLPLMVSSYSTSADASAVATAPMIASALEQRTQRGSSSLLHDSTVAHASAIATAPTIASVLEQRTQRGSGSLLRVSGIGNVAHALAIATAPCLQDGYRCHVQRMHNCGLACGLHQWARCLLHG